MEQADGMFDLENNRNDGDPGDPFPGTSGSVEFGPTTSPSNRLYGGPDPGFTIYNIRDDGQDTIISISFGSGPAQPDISVMPDSHDFGSVRVGNTASKEFLIVNRGNADLNVNDIVISGSDSSFFRLETSGGSQSCGTSVFTLLSGDYCSIVVVFAPGEERVYSASLEVSSDDPDTPVFRVPLSGYGFESVNEEPDTGCEGQNRSQALITLIPVGFLILRRTVARVGRKL